MRPVPIKLAVFLLCGLVTAVNCEELAPKNAGIDASSICARRISLDQLQALALQNSPLFAEIQSEYAKEMAKAFEAETPPNPELQVEQVYTRMGLQGADDPQTNAALSQKIRLSNFGQRQRVARLLREVGDRQRDLKLLETTQRIALQFYTLYSLQRSLEILVESEKRASSKVSLVHEGVKKGLLSDGEHKLFEGEKYRIQAQRKGLEASIGSLQAEMGRSVGFACSAIVSGEAVLPKLPSEEVLLSKAQQGQLSQSARADLLLLLASEQSRLAELDAYPEVAPRLVYQHTNDGGDFLGAGITVPLPFFNRNQGEIARAQAEQRALSRKKALLEAGGLEAQIKALHAASMRAHEQSDIFATKVIPAYEAALASQERLLSQGKGNVLQVLQIVRVLNDARSEALSFYLAEATTRVQLSLLVGEEV